jgi:circadian clock protein KaiC
LSAVRATKAERLFIDGLAGFERASLESHRIVEFFAALTNELRATRVTTVSTWEVKELSGPWISNPSPEILSQLDNVIGMRHERHGGALRRTISILKVRDSLFDTSIAEVSIDSSGAGLRIVGNMPAGLTAPGGEALQR